MSSGVKIRKRAMPNVNSMKKRVKLFRFTHISPLEAHRSGLVFYLCLSKLLTNKGTRYICNISSRVCYICHVSPHWLRSCRVIDRERTHTLRHYWHWMTSLDHHAGKRPCGECADTHHLVRHLGAIAAKYKSEIFPHSRDPRIDID